MTAWARLARENSEQSCGNGGAMESQQPAFHSSLGISQKTRDSHIPTAPATGCFTGTKNDSKTKNESRLHKSLDTAEVSPVLTFDLVAALSISNGKVKRL